jgi:thymidine kinase
MFTENTINPGNRSGWIEVISGSMFSGKTEELIRRLKRAKLAEQKVEIFKPSFDTRYKAEEVVSHDENAIHSTPVESALNILMLSDNVEVVGIDEAQFFDKGLLEVCNKLANKGVRVIVAGLDMDYLGKPFGPIPDLLAVADYITKVHAICLKCGNLAQFTHRKSDNNKRVLLGEKDIYEPLCRRCYTAEMKLT